MPHSDIHKLESRAVEELGKALDIVASGTPVSRKLGKIRYRNALARLEGAAYRLGQSDTYWAYKKNAQVKVLKPPVNIRQIKERVRLVSGRQFADYIYDKGFMAYETKYKKRPDLRGRQLALIEEWKARLPKTIVQTEAQDMYNQGAASVALTVEVK